MKPPLSRPLRQLASIPLFWVITIPLAVSALGSLAGAGYFSYRNNQVVVEDLGQDLVDKTHQIIHQELEDYLEMPLLINQINTEAVDQYGVDVEEAAALEELLWDRLQQFDEVTGVMFASPTGRLRLVERFPDQRLVVAEPDQPNRVQVYELGPAGERGALVETVDNFDVRRDRPWYGAAVERGGLGWNPLFQQGTSDHLTLNASQPVYEASGGLLGVFAVHLRLDYLSAVLQSLEIGQVGHVLITDANGTILATSTPEPPYRLEGGSSVDKRFRSLTLSTSQDPFLRALDPVLRQENLLARATETAVPMVQFRYEDEVQYVSVARFQDAYGLDWRIITVAPEGYFLGNLAQHQRQAMLLWLLGVISALGLGLVVAKLFLRRLGHYHWASQALAAGDLSQRLPTDSPIRELNGLAGAFNQMADQLQQSFHRIQTALDESETKFTTIFRTSPVPMAIATLAEGRILEVNHSLLAVLGQSQAAMVGHTALELNLWADLDQRQHCRQLLGSEGRVRDFEVEVRTATGEILTVLLSAEVQTLSGQDQVILTFHDITDRKRMELALKESEARFREISETSPANIYILVQRPDGSVYFEHISRAIEVIHEIPVADILADAQVLLNRIHPDDQADYAAAVQHSLDTLQPFHHEWRVMNPSGAIKWLQGSSIPKRRPGGEVAWYGVVIDITQRRQAEAHLRQTEQWLRQYSQISPTMIYTYVEAATGENWFEYLSSALEDIGGITVEDGLRDASVVRGLIHPANREAYLQAETESEAALTAFSHQCRIVTPAGQVKWVHVQSQPERRRDGSTAWHGVVVDISAEKQMEEARLQSEAQKRAILDALPDLIVRTRRDGTYLEIKPATTFPTALPHFVVGNNLRQVLPPDLLPPYLQIMERAFATGETQCYEYAIDVQGETLWQEVRMVPMGHEEMLFVVRNLTDLHRMTRALQESEARFRQLAETVEEGFFVYEIDSQEYSYVNPAYWGIRGLEPAAVPDSMDQWLSGIHPEDRPRIDAALLRERRGENFDQEYRYFTSTGQMRWLRSKAFPLRDDRGQVTRIVGTVENITERRLAEDALRQSETRFRRAFDHAPYGISLVSPTGQFVMANPKYCALLGYSEAELRQITFQDITHPDDYEADWDAFQRMMAGDSSACQIEKRYLTKQGETIPVIINAAPVYDTSGQLLYSVGHVQDIRERLAIDRMKDEFISIVSHELRTPITSIQGALALLGAGVYTNRPEKAKAMLNIAINNSERLVHLVDDILSFERLESGRVQLEPEPCQVEDIFAQAIDSVQALANQAHITLDAQPIAATLQAAPDAIVQTLTNLLSNAIKFSAPGSTVWLRATTIDHLPDHPQPIPVGARSPRPHRSLAPEANYVLITVQDQGRGIPADKLDHIFEQFQQVDASDSRQRGGTGLGLAICKRIVEQHRGHIWVESQLGQGSTFYVVLPLTLAQEELLGTHPSQI
ncbi:MAG: PAS domain S-box protein [Spirulina sp.]